MSKAQSHEFKFQHCHTELTESKDSVAEHWWDINYAVYNIGWEYEELFSPLYKNAIWISNIAIQYVSALCIL